ncbi:hypothetical protein BDY24DRAFT_443293 [Mrakia frigida]|uniref:DNA polymerase epsilon noncatalytic subunit n=1 Tax=Mrakia frigida TaxID=29902 RepID=UPI003FCC0D2D
MPRPSTAISGTSADKQEEAIFQGIESFELQKTIVTKLAKGALPANIKLQKDVISAISKSASVFINYLAATAHEGAVTRNVKTISASDVLKAVTNADFYPEELLPLLQAELEAFRANNGANPSRRRKSSVSDHVEAPVKKGGRKSDPVESTEKKKGPVVKLRLNGNGSGKGKEREVPVGVLGGEGDDDDLTSASDDDDDDEEDEEEEDPEEDDEEEEEEEDLPGAKGLEEGGGEMEEDSDGE